MRATNGRKRKAEEGFLRQGGRGWGRERAIESTDVAARAQSRLGRMARPPYAPAMCTLIMGLEVAGADSLVIAANRDEDPGRPATPPGLLATAPRIVGGRDLVSRGTWLAVRVDGLVVAVLNRRPAAAANARARTDGSAAPRSRGLLALELAAALPAPLVADFVPTAVRLTVAALAGASYQGCSLALLGPGGGAIVTHEPAGAPRVAPLTPGWHVITHTDLDDPSEPRTAWLLDQLAGWEPGAWEPARPRLAELLATHAAPERGIPAVCLHDGRMVTVSSSLLHLAPGAIRYLHVEGPPCRKPVQDQADLLAHAKRLPGNH